jgi:hypothetical protein
MEPATAARAPTTTESATAKVSTTSASSSAAAVAGGERCRSESQQREANCVNNLFRFHV